jgi:hypothetical protein
MQPETLPRPNISSAPNPAAPDNGGAANRRRRLPRWIPVAAVLAIAAVVAAAVLLTRGDDTPALGEASVVSAEKLSSLADTSDTPVFWAGDAADGFKLEFTEVRGGRVYVRYLTADAKAGDPRPAFTTVATYPMQGAFEQLRESADNPGAVSGNGAAGATTLYYRKAPSSVYVAQPGSDHLIEVFAPQPSAALEIASSPSLVQVP